MAISKKLEIIYHNGQPDGIRSTCKNLSTITTHTCNSSTTCDQVNNKAMLEETIKQYHERRKHLTIEEAGEAQKHATEDIIRNATEQALRILKDMGADREIFRKIGFTFEEKAFYDILMSLRDEYNFEYGTDKKVDGIMVNDKCKALAKKIKEIIDTKSSFADWLNNQIVRNQLRFDTKVCLIKNGYPPQYSPEVFRKVMEQVENFEENN